MAKWQFGGGIEAKSEKKNGQGWGNNNFQQKFMMNFNGKELNEQPKVNGIRILNYNIITTALHDNMITHT